MKTFTYSISKNQFLLSLLFLTVTQVAFTQKKNNTAIIKKEITVVPKKNEAVCDCNAIDFKVRIIKLSEPKAKRTYKLQIIDFVNINNCPIKFFNLNWKGQQMIPMTSMRNQTFEKATDGSVALYEFDFDTKTTAIEPEDGSPISTSILIKIGDKSCFIRDKIATYYSQM